MTQTVRAQTFPCPRCRQPSAWQDNPHRPFCSERCRLLDLGAWASESYRIAEPAPEQTAQPWEAQRPTDD